MARGAKIISTLVGNTKEHIQDRWNGTLSSTSAHLMVSLKAARWKVRFWMVGWFWWMGKWVKRRTRLRFHELFLIKFESSNCRLTLDAVIFSIYFWLILFNFPPHFHPSFVKKSYPLNLQEPRSAARASAAVPLTQPASRPTKFWHDCRPRRKRPTRTG